MARSRNIKPGFFTNDDLGEMDPLARLLFAGMWTIADKSGRLEDRPKKIKAEVLPYDSCDAEPLLCALASKGFILRYEADGKRFIQVVAWGKHQNPHCKEAASTIPAPDGFKDQTEQAPDEHGASTVQAPVEAQPLPERAGLIPDSLNLIPDSSQPNGCVAPQSVAAKPKRGTRLAQDWFLPQAWGQWAQEKYPHFTVEIIRDEALKFANHWRAATGKGSSKLDWYATWQNWCMSEICQRAHPPPGKSTEGAYARQMRERVEEATGSLAHVVAAKAPGTVKPPWEIAIEQRRTAAIGMDGCDLLEADPALRSGLPEPVRRPGHGRC